MIQFDPTNAPSNSDQSSPHLTPPHLTPPHLDNSDTAILATFEEKPFSSMNELE
jgi:hypothetical protein